MRDRLHLPRRIVADEPEVKTAPPEKETEDETKDESKTVRMQGEVSSMPVVTRDGEGNVTRASFDAKVRFKGTVKVNLRGSVASAYWSVTPGMLLLMSVEETGEKVYRAVALDIIQPV
jgi:hypothetical protein